MLYDKCTKSGHNVNINLQWIYIQLQLEIYIQSLWYECHNNSGLLMISLNLEKRKGENGLIYTEGNEGSGSR